MWAEDYEYEKNVNTKKIHLSMLKKILWNSSSVKYFSLLFLVCRSLKTNFNLFRIVEWDEINPDNIKI